MTIVRTALTYENVELIRRLTEDGWGERRIAKRLGISCRSVGRAREEMGLDVTQPEPYVDEVAVQRAVNGDRGMTLNHLERRLAVDQLTSRGLSAAEIADVLGITRRSVTRWRSRIGAAA